MRFLAMLAGVVLLIEVVKILALAVVALVVILALSAGTRAAFLEQVRRYNLTHGRRAAGGIGGRRK
jgi:hypothetical protein